MSFISLLENEAGQKRATEDWRGYLTKALIIFGDRKIFLSFNFK